jgi:hypothetical protein
MVPYLLVRLSLEKQCHSRGALASSLRRNAPISYRIVPGEIDFTGRRGERACLFQTLGPKVIRDFVEKIVILHKFHNKIRNFVLLLLLAVKE